MGLCPNGLKLDLKKKKKGFGVVDHAQIDRQQTPMIDLGVAGHCMCCGRGTGFHSVEF